ncbi:MAG: hypothetical protein JW751_21760 [Polyangiaceae bacterium]|nr:hypothetical protein [Polyangiaceae bacterium]
MAAVLALPGCGADSRAPAADYDLSSNDPSLDPLVDAYPPGPYGGALGDVIRDYTFEGYVTEPSDRTAPLAFATLTMNDLRLGTAPFALLVMAETWCANSRITADELGLEAERGAAAGGEILEVLLDGDRDLAQRWIRDHELGVTTVYPLDPSFEETMGGLEWAVIINLKTQLIVWRDFGSTVAEGAPLAVRGVDELVHRCARVE